MAIRLHGHSKGQSVYRIRGVRESHGTNLAPIGLREIDRRSVKRVKFVFTFFFHPPAPLSRIGVRLLVGVCRHKGRMLFGLLLDSQQMRIG